MKKGISLIVLVITIIVLAILAGAIIISLSNTNIMTEAANAVTASDLANARNVVALEYSAALSRGIAAGAATGHAYQDGKAPTFAADGTMTEGTPMKEQQYLEAIASAFGKDLTTITAIYNVDVDETTGQPLSVTLDKDATAAT